MACRIDGVGGGWVLTTSHRLDFDAVIRRLDHPSCNSAEFRLHAPTLKDEAIRLYRRDATSPIVLQLDQVDKEGCRSIRQSLSGIRFDGPIGGMGYDRIWFSIDVPNGEELRTVLSYIGTTLSIPVDIWHPSESGETWPLRRVFAVMSVLVVAGGLGCYFAVTHVESAVPRYLLLGSSFLIGASGLAVIILNSVEALPVRMWNRWSCPACGKRYEVHQHSDARFWGFRGRTESGSGVILVCWHCGLEQSFTSDGRPVDLN